MGHTGGYTREEAIEAIEAEGVLPDMLSFDRQARKDPNGRVFTDDVIDHRLAFLSKGEIPSACAVYTDVLPEFPYLGAPHPKKG